MEGARSPSTDSTPASASSEICSLSGRAAGWPNIHCQVELQGGQAYGNFIFSFLRPSKAGNNGGKAKAEISKKNKKLSNFSVYTDGQRSLSF